MSSPTPSPSSAASLGPDEIAAIRARHEKAWQEVADLCSKPGHRWTMRVPAEEDRDSDLVIGAALNDIPNLLALLGRADQ